MRKTGIFLIPVLALSLAACEAGREGEQTGTIAGAAAGALIGSQIGGSGTSRTLATIIGAAAGAYIGGEIGKSLDGRDRSMMQQTTQNALETAPPGQTRSWNNPDSGNSGSVTPQDPYQTAEGQFCREYQETVTANSEVQTGYRTACRQSDGTWRVVGN